MTAPTMATAELTAPQWPQRARQAGWVLLACWIILIGAAVFAGQRASTLPALRKAVATGDRDGYPGRWWAA
jgi:hypothetical protein